MVFLYLLLLCHLAVSWNFLFSDPRGASGSVFKDLELFRRETKPGRKILLFIIGDKTRASENRQIVVSCRCSVRLRSKT